MKTLLTGLLLLVASSTLVAAELTQEQLKVQAMVQELKETPAGERYQKMNAFKAQVRLMSTEQRTEALEQLGAALENGEQLQTRTRTQTRTNEGTGEGDQIRTRTQERTQLQTQQDQLKMQNQMQNQRRLGKMGVGSAGGNKGLK